ncbi:unnamed protein product [Mytilus coruscus]|uniref:MULE transposase domain-containing protein n=1 Tax=Mytilus coruscus TaxID=42192 RepID=A0A6J8D775_MYTCO|nr:unnamed protein product [Mytilus coruscus]
MYRQCTEMYCDETFRTCTKPYEQYSTIHGGYRNRMLCFVSCLMTARNIGDYRHVLQILTVKIRHITGHRWHPRKVICDFELALLAAVVTELPHAQVSECYFQFNQSLWRKVQNLGLAASYRRQPAVKRVVRKNYGHWIPTNCCCASEFLSFENIPQNSETAGDILD